MDITNRNTVKKEMAGRKRVLSMMIVVRWVVLVAVLALTWYFNQWPALCITILTVYTSRLGASIRNRQMVDARLTQLFDKSTASSVTE